MVPSITKIFLCHEYLVLKSKKTGKNLFYLIFIPILGRERFINIKNSFVINNRIIIDRKIYSKFKKLIKY